jgi:hypothetical protein
MNLDRQLLLALPTARHNAQQHAGHPQQPNYRTPGTEILETLSHSFASGSFCLTNSLLHPFDSTVDGAAFLGAVVSQRLFRAMPMT